MNHNYYRYVVPNGTLMGTSMVTCFGAWLVLSGILYVLCFLLGAEVPPLKLLSVFVSIILLLLGIYFRDIHLRLIVLSCF